MLFWLTRSTLSDLCISFMRKSQRNGQKKLKSQRIWPRKFWKESLLWKNAVINQKMNMGSISLKNTLMKNRTPTSKNINQLSASTTRSTLLKSKLTPALRASLSKRSWRPFWWRNLVVLCQMMSWWSGTGEPSSWKWLERQQNRN